MGRVNHRYRKPIRTVSPTVRQLCVILDELDTPYYKTEKAAGLQTNTFSRWRLGVNAPNIINLENVVKALGYRIVLERIEEDVG